MEFKNTLEIVTKDIQDIEKLVSNFKNYSSIPNIELDLALSRLRNVYDLLLLIKSDNAVPKDSVKVDAGLPVAEVPKFQVEEVLVKPAPVAPPVKKPEPIEEPVTEVSKQKTVSPPIAEKPVGSKKPAEEKTYINEKLGEQTHKKDVSTKLQGQAIKSIAGSLGINDKFFFIRELFAGNAETFRQTMADLDDAHNFNDAYSVLINNFQWDMDSEPVQMLLNLVRRKFITSGNE